MKIKKIIAAAAACLMVVSASPADAKPKKHMKLGDACINFHMAPGYPEPTERPDVFTINGTVRVDNRCNEVDGLVIVWKVNDFSETFWAYKDSYVSHPTLYTGSGIKVWIRFNDGSEYTYTKTMNYTN